MATLKIRGKAYNVVYSYKDKNNVLQRQWETYYDEVEAATRKALLDLYKAKNDKDALYEAAMAYKKESEQTNIVEIAAKEVPADTIDKKKATYEQFFEKFLPLYGRKKRISPATYDGYTTNIEEHILPYFKNSIIYNTTAEQIDDFVDYLTTKKCGGSKAYNKTEEEIPTLSSSSIQKIYTNYYTALKIAKSWGYINEVPYTQSPAAKHEKRKAWTSGEVSKNLDLIDDPLLHLTVHLIFICSLRSGEAGGVGIADVMFDATKPFIKIKNTLARVSDKSMKELNPKNIYKVFPKQKDSAKSQLVLKSPKTEESVRMIYLTPTLANEIRDRLEQIERDKAYYGKKYNDNGLLLCHPNGNPLETTILERRFKKWQKKVGIENQIEIQGLRKSSSMYKLRLNKNNYQEVIADTGHVNPKVLFSHYNEIFDEERQEFADKIENDFYSGQPLKEESTQLKTLFEKLKNDPNLVNEISERVL